MKKLLPLLTVFLVVLIIVVLFVSMSKQKEMVVIYENNHSHEPVKMKFGHFQDTQCGMTIDKMEDSVQAVNKDGDTWFFDDVGCFALWFKNVSDKENTTVWVYSRDSKKYIDGKKAWYTIDSKTVMEYGFAAYENKKEGLIRFDDMLLRMYRGENLTNPLIRNKILGE